MKLSYSYIHREDSNQTELLKSNNIDFTDKIGARIPYDHIGKGLYSSVDTNTQVFPKNIQPDADVYSAYFFDKSAVPGYTRLGNNSQSKNCFF